MAIRYVCDRCGKRIESDMVHGVSEIIPFDYVDVLVRFGVERGWTDAGMERFQICPDCRTDLLGWITGDGR